MEDPLEVLRRWENSGGTWRVVARTPDRLALELLTCDAGEVMGRVESRPPDAALRDHVDAVLSEGLNEGLNEGPDVSPGGS